MYFSYTPPDGEELDGYLSKLAHDGLEKHLKNIQDRQCGIRPDQEHEYRQRLNEELKVIQDLCLASYFLIAVDLVEWARKNGIIVGAGRGAITGSLVAHVMGIIELDPISYNLVFECFINSKDSTTDLPITLDLGMDTPEKVIEYMHYKYGEGFNSKSPHVIGFMATEEPLVELCQGFEDQESGFDAIKFSGSVGGMKFDIRNLKVLDVIDSTVRQVRVGMPEFDLQQISNDDYETCDLLRKGNTLGVFQLESPDVQELLVKTEPSCFEDLIAVCALGLSNQFANEIVEHFVECRHGRSLENFELPELEAILKNTHGAILYQEQVMQIAHTLAGYSFNEAARLCLTIQQNDPIKTGMGRERFVAALIQRGITETNAERLFNMMIPGCVGGISKAQNAAYALIAYRAAYLKAHHPKEYMAALLSSNMPYADKLNEYISDCHYQGITILPPDINESMYSFRVTGNAIRFGLGAVKGLDGVAVEAILEARQAAPFIDMNDFCKRVDMRRVNRKALNELNKSRSFDSIEGFCFNNREHISCLLG